MFKLLLPLKVLVFIMFTDKKLAIFALCLIYLWDFSNTQNFGAGFNCLPVVQFQESLFCYLDTFVGILTFREHC